MRVGDTPVLESKTWGTRIIMPGGTVWAPPPPPPKPKQGEHEALGARSFGVVYANETARRVFAGERRGPYPVGSVIVRERLPAPDAAAPDLLAVMVKRPRGFNPKGGDWEFLLADGGGTKIHERQKKGSCLECHASQRERDYVFPLPTKIQLR